MNGATAAPERFVESSLQRYRPKKRRHRVGVGTAAPIERALKLDASGRLIVNFWLQAIQGPSHDAPAHLAKQRAEVAFKSHHL
jgi:hypothetical protein